MNDGMKHPRCCRGTQNSDSIKISKNHHCRCSVQVLEIQTTSFMPFQQFTPCMGVSLQQLHTVWPGSAHQVNRRISYRDRDKCSVCVISRPLEPVAVEHPVVAWTLYFQKTWVRSRQVG